MSTNIERELVRENNKLRKRIEELEKNKETDQHIYKYLIFYNYSSDTSAGTDVMELSLGKEISGINDINYLRNCIKIKKEVDQVIITNFKLVKVI